MFRSSMFIDEPHAENMNFLIVSVKKLKKQQKFSTLKWNNFSPEHRLIWSLHRWQDAVQAFDDLFEW